MGGMGKQRWRNIQPDDAATHRERGLVRDHVQRASTDTRYLRPGWSRERSWRRKRGGERAAERTLELPTVGTTMDVDTRLRVICA